MTRLSHPLVLGQSGHEYLTNFDFQLSATWSACRLCGVVFQSELDRSPDPADAPKAYAMRQEWRKKHEAQNHTAREIADLEKSGLAVTPEAAYNLAPYGIIPIGDAGGVRPEIDEALFEAPRAPINDAES